MRNGLYSIHVTLGDGRMGKGSGVLVFRDGEILGGDAFLFYVGTYQVRGSVLFGEVVINQHTPSPDSAPLFGGRQVGIGFSGPFTGSDAVLDGTALVGRESVIFRGTLKKLVESAGLTEVV
ncbi:GrlR family regulatory protein [uncultured Enterovirga sp.]|uniref:GrlR family regulatory protein n=1 Tax=uncultured Enterovirga sp. TaxID=2026352 RepID=UPI0035CC8E36